MLNEVKHLGCAHVDVHEILRQYIKNFSQTNFVLLYMTIRILPNCHVGAYRIRPENIHVD